MNEDEQVLLFSIVKTKMLVCSQKLLVVFEYRRFHELMRCVKTLEKNITNYQDTLRTQIYDGEIKKYHEVGREKLDEFLDRYEKKFEFLNNARRQREEQFSQKRLEEREELEKQLGSDSHLVKFKPKRELREYLKNERLVALEERIEEAVNFRKELEKISQKETLRLNHNV